MNGLATGRTARPGEDRTTGRRAAAGLLLSIALHILLFATFLPYWLADPLPLAEAGGAGWADEVELKAAKDSSDGAQGAGEQATIATHKIKGNKPDKLEIQVVYLAKEKPKLPEPEGDLNLPPLPPRVTIETEVAEQVEEKPREPVQQQPERLSNTDQASAAAAAGEVGAAKVANENNLGGGGSRDTAAGSPAGDAANGAGSGNSDRKARDGDYVRGNQIASILQGGTLVGTEGGWDGSTGDNAKTRITFRWEAYYAPDGTVEVRFETYGSTVPHGPIGVQRFSDTGSWSIQGDLLCQKIEDVGYGVPICFEVHHKDGNRVAMYYAECGGLHRCYRGRLGPEGVVLPGRQFTM